MRGWSILNKMKPTHANVAKFGLGLNMIGCFSCIGINVFVVKRRHTHALHQGQICILSSLASLVNSLNNEAKASSQFS